MNKRSGRPVARDDVAEEFGHVPNRLASRLASQRTGSVSPLPVQATRR